MDPRTGFGRYRDFRISNYQLMDCLIEHLRVMPVDEIMELEDLQERVRLYHAHREPFAKMMTDHSWTEGAAVITDLRGLEETYWATGTSFTRSIRNRTSRCAFLTAKTGKIAFFPWATVS